MRRSDEAGLRDMFLRCSTDDLRLRCFGISKTFPEVFAARLARLTGGAEFAILAVAPSGEVGGVVHAVGLADGTPGHGATPTTTSWSARTSRGRASARG